jgi:hypothetical protein
LICLLKASYFFNPSSEQKSAIDMAEMIRKVYEVDPLLFPAFSPAISCS